MVLMDEIEKAHPDVFNILLQVPFCYLRCHAHPKQSPQTIGDPLYVAPSTCI